MRKISIEVIMLAILSVFLLACGRRDEEQHLVKIENETSNETSAAVSSSVSKVSWKDRSSQYAEQIVSGLMEQVWENFSENLAAQLPVESLQRSWDEVVGEAERYQGIEAVSERTEEGKIIDLVTLRYAKKEGRTIEFTYNEKGEIVGIFFDVTELKSAAEKSTTKSKASSNGKDTVTTKKSGEELSEKKSDKEQLGKNSEEKNISDYEEVDVTVGRKPYLLKGILALPEGTQTPPVVILLPDGTELDQDGTIGEAENKPLRDIAKGLAAKGVASLRYEQREYAYAEKIPSNSDAVELLTEDAGFAVSQMFNERRIDREQIYILAMGGSADYVPAIVADKPKRIAGAILMGAKPVAVTKTYYGQDESKNIFSDAKYFAENNTTFPLLVLQGEEDFETTMVEFEAWKALWKGRSHTSYQSFSKLNHYFMRSTGVEDKTEYDVENSVNSGVIKTIAEWIDAGEK